MISDAGEIRVVEGLRCPAGKLTTGYLKIPQRKKKTIAINPLPASCAAITVNQRFCFTATVYRWELTSSGGGRSNIAGNERHARR